MSDIITAGLDLAKNVFQVHGADGAERAVLRKRTYDLQVMRERKARHTGNAHLRLHTLSYCN